jgi:hypothetical protein
MCKYRSILESELLILLLGQLFVGLYVDQWAKGQNGISNCSRQLQMTEQKSSREWCTA